MRYDNLAWVTSDDLLRAIDERDRARRIAVALEQENAALAQDYAALERQIARLWDMIESGGKP